MKKEKNKQTPNHDQRSGISYRHIRNQIMQPFAFNPTRSKATFVWQFRERYWLFVDRKWCENRWFFLWSIVNWYWFPFPAWRLSIHLFSFFTRSGGGGGVRWRELEWRRWVWRWIGWVLVEDGWAQRMRSGYIRSYHILSRFSRRDGEWRWVDCRRNGNRRPSRMPTRRRFANRQSKLVHIWSRWRCGTGLIWSRSW